MRYIEISRGVERFNEIVNLFDFISNNFDLYHIKKLKPLIVAVKDKGLEFLNDKDCTPPIAESVTRFLALTGFITRCKGVTRLNKRCKRRQIGYFCHQHCEQYTDCVKTGDLKTFKRVFYQTEGTVNYLMNRGNINIFKYINSCGVIEIDYDRAMKEACKRGNLRVVRFLYAQKNDVVHIPENIRNAFVHGHIDIVRFLKECDVDILKLLFFYDAFHHNHSHLCIYLKTCRVVINPYFNWKNIGASYIWEFYKRQRQRKRLWNVMKQIIPLYYHPQARGGYFARKQLAECIAFKR